MNETKKTLTTKEINEIYKKHYSPVSFYVKKYIKNDLDAEETINDTFIKAFNHIATFNTDLAKFETWLYTIAKYCAIDFLKKKKIDTLSIDESNKCDNEEYSRSIEIIDTSLSPHDIMVKKERIKNLKEKIKLLPTNIKFIIEQYYIYELKMEEISSKYNIPLGTVKVSIMRGKELLKNML